MHSLVSVGSKCVVWITKRKSTDIDHSSLAQLSHEFLLLLWLDDDQIIGKQILVQILFPGHAIDLRVIFIKIGGDNLHEF
jgi:hypothetical protein